MAGSRNSLLLMSADLFICPTADALSITVEEIRERFVAAGLGCAIETRGAERWIVFDGNKSELVFTTEKDGRAASAVMQAAMEDPPAFGERVLKAFESFGWRYVEDEI